MKKIVWTNERKVDFYERHKKGAKLTDLSAFYEIGYGLAVKIKTQVEHAEALARIIKNRRDLEAIKDSISL